MPAALDDTFYPILLSIVEEPSRRSELEAYFQKLCALADRAIRRGERYTVIVVKDPSGYSAAARKLVAEVQASYITPERNAVTLVALVPFDSAITRGTLTALRWLAPQLLQFAKPVPTLDVAVDEALRALELNGTPFRGDLPALCRALGLSARGRAPQA